MVIAVFVLVLAAACFVNVFLGRRNRNAYAQSGSETVGRIKSWNRYIRRIDGGVYRPRITCYELVIDALGREFLITTTNRKAKKLCEGSEVVICLGENRAALKDDVKTKSEIGFSLVLGAILLALGAVGIIIELAGAGII